MAPKAKSKVLEEVPAENSQDQVEAEPVGKAAPHIVDNTPSAEVKQPATEIDRSDRSRRTTADDRDLILSLKRKGLSNNEISTQSGFSTATISNVLKKFNGGGRSPYIPPKPEFSELQDVTMEIGSHVLSIAMNTPAALGSLPIPPDLITKGVEILRQRLTASVFGFVKNG